MKDRSDDPSAPWANALTTELYLAPSWTMTYNGFFNIHSIFIHAFLWLLFLARSAKPIFWVADLIINDMSDRKYISYFHLLRVLLVSQCLWSPHVSLVILTPSQHWRSRGYCRRGPNIYGRPYWCIINTVASEIAAYLKVPPPCLLRHCFSK